MAKNGESVSRPNVIYILCDDLGYGELGYNGQKKIQTPELDNLASKGMILRNHYCANAVSAASRCGLMTGKHPGHALIRANSPGYPNGQFPLRENSETLGKLMQRAGYKTACIGKWGLGLTAIPAILISRDLTISLAIQTKSWRMNIIQFIYGATERK